MVSDCAGWASVDFLRLKNFIIVVLECVQTGVCEGAYRTTVARSEEMVRLKGAGQRSQLRIIGGQWRGRKLSFTPESGLRPTTDRVRETLFNWLAPDIRDARCADLFAGSGALGLEALSRGAAHCDFVDNSSGAVTQIGQHLAVLEATARGQCHEGTALQFLQGGHDAWDIVFIDPPFSLGLVEPACSALAQHGLVASGALVYVETAATEAAPEIPGWTLHRDKTAGGVAYRLFTTD
jgi:16S rRNA (guanine966-N2)-methyltransferase